MPVYAYACTACGHAFDARQSFDEPSLTVCEACGGALRKQFGTIGVTFNGSGFYRTDSRASSASSSGSGSRSSSSGAAKAAPSTSSSGAGTAA
ncbi:FmdB family zinc ribbon protein [Agrococcus sp. SCSIO52902]|uniref:FmdB family zinc ribbon protein n=1 Tax=Agrococcus sp. SCSIO52902 TaxID=2933290 RepID=UPI001FF1AC53|nr:FmdB family zinc ribbon protein [Agrococcus sp. SCSIO52902]UOV99845.1 FmdB family transcriptional regulator [Agrococcus sp. SCSIO52902]